jgi:hypothetical protein
VPAPVGFRAVQECFTRHENAPAQEVRSDIGFYRYQVRLTGWPWTVFEVVAFDWCEPDCTGLISHNPIIFRDLVA